MFLKLKVKKVLSKRGLKRPSQKAQKECDQGESVREVDRCETAYTSFSFDKAQGTCPSQLSIVVIKNTDQKQLGRKWFIGLHIQFTVHH